MRYLSTLLSLCVLFLAWPSGLLALTFKSDGSVVQSDGRVTRQSDAARYIEALAAYQRGEAVTGFPVNRPATNLFGLPVNRPAPAGFFGTDIVAEGAPLMPLPATLDSSDPVGSIAENLGMNEAQFSSALVLTSSRDWQQANNIPAEALAGFADRIENFLAAEEQVRKLQAEGLAAINGTKLTADDIRAGALDQTLGEQLAIVNADPAVIWAYEARLDERLAGEAGVRPAEISFVRSSLGELASPASAAGLAAIASQQFNQPEQQRLANAASEAMQQAERLNLEAERLAAEAKRLGTKQAFDTAEQAYELAAAASESARLAGEAAERAGRVAAGTASSAAFNQAGAAALKASEQASSEAVSAAGKQAGLAVIEAASAAGQNAVAAASLAAGAIEKAALDAAEQAGTQAAYEAATQAANQAIDAVYQAAFDAAKKAGLSDAEAGAAAGQAALDAYNSGQ